MIYKTSCGFAIWTAVAVSALSIGCQAGADDPPRGQSERSPSAPKGSLPMKLTVTSAAFLEGQPVPKKNSGEGEDLSPAIAWTEVPNGTRELALICDDPDAPSPEPWVHWVIYKIPAASNGLPEGIPRTLRLAEPAGAVQGKNSWSSGDTIGYRGPMPPPGRVHHYRFSVYALDVELDLEPGLDKRSVWKAVQGHVVAEGRLTGTYQR
jgi:Raf kinase inhibitor-like YbhB/YbcL family protein